MIVFGTRPKYKTIGEGQFFCPRCQQIREYKHKQATRYFTLYFIPVIPMGKMGEIVECQTCHAMFEPFLLQAKPQPAQPRANLAQILNTLGERLSRGEPLEYLMRDLTAAGLDRDIAMQMINAKLTGGRKTCDSCGLTYTSSVERCMSCGRVL
jgi:hypothetical protein